MLKILLKSTIFTPPKTIPILLVSSVRVEIFLN